MPPLFFISVFASCAITATRPSQEMSNMEVSIRAAKEVSADLYAPELYRVALETSQQARAEYKFKNFQNAKKLADQARVYAEKAEFESIRNGGKRDLVPQDPLAEPSSLPEPLATPITNDSGAPGAAPSGTPPPSTK